MAAKLLQLGLLVGWGALLWAGGLLLVGRAYHLPRRERLAAGLAAGLLVDVLLAGLLSRIAGAGMAFGLAAILTLLLGIAVNLPFGKGNGKDWMPARSDAGLLLILAAGVGVFALIGRGTSPASDAHSLPLVSLLAAGEGVRWAGGALFNEILAAQVMRLGGLSAWLALDLARALSLSLAALLAGLWARRATGSALAGWCAGLLGWLGGGARWLLLLFPAAVLNWLGADAQLLRASGSWLGGLANRAGGLDVPFLLASDLPAALFSQGMTGGTLLAGVLLLGAGRWRGWRGALVTGLLLAGAALSAPWFLIVVLAGLLLGGAAAWARGEMNPARRGRWLAWLGMGVGAGLALLALGLPLPAANWRWPPRVISADWGGLSLLNPRHGVVLLVESGWLIALAAPGLAWCWRAWRAGRWYEAGFLSLPLLGGLSLLLGGADWARELQTAVPGFAFSAIGVSAAWMWARRHTGSARGWLAAAWLVALVGGGVSLGAALAAAPRPVLAAFIEPLDAQVMDDHWDALEPQARVFDPRAARGETLFARTSGLDEAAQARLSANPQVEALLAEGVDYLYYGWADWKTNEKAYHQIQELSCARVVSEYAAKRGEDYRVLVDLRGCR